MKAVEILGANRFETYTKTREGCRAVIVQDGKILLTGDPRLMRQHFLVKHDVSPF